MLISYIVVEDGVGVGGIAEFDNTSAVSPTDRPQVHILLLGMLKKTMGIKPLVVYISLNWRRLNTKA
jgi:hypothetical protein